MKIGAWLCRALRIILFPLWWPAWRLLRKLNVVVSLFLAREVGYLLVLMSMRLLVPLACKVSHLSANKAKLSDKIS